MGQGGRGVALHSWRGYSIRLVLGGTLTSFRKARQCLWSLEGCHGVHTLDDGKVHHKKNTYSLFNSGGKSVFDRFEPSRCACVVFVSSREVTVLTCSVNCLLFEAVVCWEVVFVWSLVNVLGPSVYHKRLSHQLLDLGVPICVPFRPKEVRFVPILQLLMFEHQRFC